MLLTEFAKLVFLAGTEDSKRAARAFLTVADERSAMLLIDAADWRDDHVLDFERRRLAVLIEGSKLGGRFWLASPQSDRVLLPPAPRIAPSHLVSLARAVVDVLLEGWTPAEHAA